MKFKPGKSGNPGGRKSLGLSPAVRKDCGLRAWKAILDIMESKIRETAIEWRDGEQVLVDVVPSVKERREAAKLVLAYSFGTPIKTADGLEDRIKILERRVRELTVTNGFHGDQYAS